MEPSLRGLEARQRSTPWRGDCLHRRAHARRADISDEGRLSTTSAKDELVSRVHRAFRVLKPAIKMQNAAAALRPAPARACRQGRKRSTIRIESRGVAASKLSRMLSAARMRSPDCGLVQVLVCAID